MTKSSLVRIRRGAITLAAIVILSVAGFKVLGEYTWLESMWMVVVTISTVGYGESPAGGDALQVLMIFTIVFGVSASVYTCGGFIQLMLEGEIDKVLGKRKMIKELSRLNDHVVVCGFGRLGHDLAVQLSHREIPFVIVDLSSERVAEAGEAGFLAVQGDATQDDVLTSLKLDEARALVSALPTDAQNVFITLTARNLVPTLQIIAKSEEESSCRKLRQAGADKIVMPHRTGAQQMERMISRPSTADLVELFAEASHLEIELDELHVSDKNPIVNCSLESSGIKNRFNLLVVGIKSGEGLFRFNPGPSETIKEGDVLLVMGEVNAINQLKDLLAN